MKTRLVEAKTAYGVRVCDMKLGQVGITPDGLIYVRTVRSAICLTDLGCSADGCASAAHTAVRLLPAGTIIELTVEDVP